MKKRVLSLLMAVMMLVALVVPASATTDTSGTVTVYVTYGMFTEGGIGEQPAYRGGIPTSTNINANFYISDYTISISDVSDCLADTQSAYAKPTTTPSSFKTPNVLDALLVAFWLNGTDITDSNKVVAGWDANPLEGNPAVILTVSIPSMLPTAIRIPIPRLSTALSITNIAAAAGTLPMAVMQAISPPRVRTAPM